MCNSVSFGVTGKDWKIGNCGTAHSELQNAPQKPKPSLNMFHRMPTLNMYDYYFHLTFILPKKLFMVIELIPKPGISLIQKDKGLQDKIHSFTVAVTYN